MNGRIDTWRIHYRFHGSASGASRLAAERARDRLDALARGPVLASFAEALDRALGDDPTVYLVRSLRIDWSVNLSRPVEDTELARRWGRRLVAALVHEIAHGIDDNVVRYADRADHAAHFVAELLAGRTAEGWWFAPFARFRHGDRRATVAAVLYAHREGLGALLGRLQQRGALRALVAALDPATLADLWARDGAAAVGGPETERPLFAAALRLWERLGGPAVSRSAAEQWFRAYAQEAPATDWGDRTGLAAGVLAAFRFLREPARGPERADAHPVPDPARLDEALADLDWLDAGWLRERLAEMDEPKWQKPIGRRPGGAATPRQREVLAEVLALLGPSGKLRPADPLWLYGALIERRPRWADDPAVAGLLRTLLTAASWAASTPAPVALLRRLRQDPAALAGAAPAPEYARAARAVATLGEPALAVVEALLPAEARAADEAAGTATDCAGVFLLLRAVRDARLPALVRRAAYPAGDSPADFGALLLALALRWAAHPAGEPIDPGLDYLAPDLPRTRSAVAAAWSRTTAEDEHRAQLALARLMLGHRLVTDPGRLHVRRVADAGGEALVAGSAPDQVWAFGAVRGATTDPAPVLARWVRDWSALVGAVPQLMVPPELAGIDAGAEVLVEEDDGGCAAALGALGQGRLGLPEADLTVGLMAVALVRVWARWLRHLGSSSLPYLMGQLIRRPGRVCRRPEGLLIELRPRPLDVVLQLSDYLAPLQAVSWLNPPVVRFALGRG